MSIKTVELTKMGLCMKCGAWLELKKGTCYVPIHVAGGEECPSSHYSAGKYKYVVKNDEDARKVAAFIKKDTGGCLVRHVQWHSLACGDGDHCHQERLRLAQALAEYLLTIVPAP